MTALKEVLSANETLHTRYESATAIFTGATQGVGLETLQAFAKHIPQPTAIIIGRSRDRFEATMQSLKRINPQGTFKFLEGQVSLIKDIDAISAQLKSILRAGSVDLVCMSQGYVPLRGREFTSEGLDRLTTLVYYGRMRLAQNLIDSHLLRANAKVVSIAIGAREGKVLADDLALERSSYVLNMRGQTASMTTLTFDRMAEHNPAMTFMHLFPGRVNTGAWTRSTNGWLSWLLITYLVEPLMFLGAISPTESGERMLHLALGEEFANGSWSLDYDGTKSYSKWLQQYREDPSIKDRIWEHNHQQFETATSE